MSDAQIKAVAALRIAGASYDQIAEQLGIARHMVAKNIRQARDMRILPERGPCDNISARRVYLRDRCNLRSGALFIELCKLPREEFEWLLGEVEDNGCTTVAEYIGQMVRYAYQVERRRDAGLAADCLKTDH